MTGLEAHCPSSGAPLSDESVYPDQDGRSLRYSTSAWASRGGGRLTNGERVSSQQALTGCFTRWHQTHHDDPDPGLYRTAATALRKLKSRPEGKTWNIYVWRALHTHLSRRGHSVDWMHAHSELVCPNCHGQLVWRPTPRGRRPYCGQDCQNGDPVDDTIEARVETVCHQAFEEHVDIEVASSD